MLRAILLGGFVLAISSAFAATASAQGYGGFGYDCGPYGGIGYSAGYAPGLAVAGYRGYGTGLSIGAYSPGFAFNYNSAPRYYAQPHWDYHPTTVRRHGNHYHVVPGHYDLHVPGRHPHHGHHRHGHHHH
jgi:hypothetical protein